MSPGHVYRYRIVGASEPLAVVVPGGPGLYGDNYGSLRVTIHEAGR